MDEAVNKHHSHEDVFTNDLLLSYCRVLVLVFLYSPNCYINRPNSNIKLIDKEFRWKKVNGLANGFFFWNVTHILTLPR